MFTGPAARSSRRSAAATAACVLASALLACGGPPRPRVDPLAWTNRAAYDLHHATARPIGHGLDVALEAVVPAPVRDAGGRFFQNLATPRILAADLAQGRVGAAGWDLARFGVNSTAGLGGLFDPATRIGIPSHDEDFGQALCAWGIPQGPYVYFPLLGPSSTLEAFTVTLDTALAPADVLLPHLATHGSRRNRLAAIRERAGEAQARGEDAYTVERLTYRSDRLRQVRDEPPQTETDLATPERQAYGTSRSGSARPRGGAPRRVRAIWPRAARFAPRVRRGRAGYRAVRRAP